MTAQPKSSPEQLPVTVLTGFLGAGKTTLLNRILSEAHGRRYFVIINEFGEIGIDHDLVVTSDETIIEMNNGCICCTVRGDLIDILTRFIATSEPFDGVLIETTGLADPGPVIQTFFVDPRIAERFRLDAVVTVADAHHLALQVEGSQEAAEQIAMADIVVLNKIDLVDEPSRKRALDLLCSLNPLASIHCTRRCDLGLALLLDRHAFDLDRILDAEPDFLVSDHAHEHDQTIASVSLASDAAMDQERVVAWLAELLQERGADILRCKGIIDVAGAQSRFAVQGVHMLLDGGFQRPWGAREPRRSRLVLIGRNLDANSLAAAFERCAAVRADTTSTARLLTSPPPQRSTS